MSGYAVLHETSSYYENTRDFHLGTSYQLSI